MVKTNISRSDNIEKSSISVLSIKFLRYSALNDSFGCLKGEDAKPDLSSSSAAIRGGLSENRRLLDHALECAERVIDAETEEDAGTEEDAETEEDAGIEHNGWAPLEMVGY